MCDVINECHLPQKNLDPWALKALSQNSDPTKCVTSLTKVPFTWS